MARELDPEALAHLRAALVGQAHRHLQDRHEAEDVAQDALIALCTTSVQFADLDHIAAYARRTVHNLCVDRIRRRIHHVHLDHVDASYDTVERDVINRDLITAVISGLSEINPVYAQVILASSDVGRDHAAIATLTGVSLRNVRHGLDRGTKALRAKLVAGGHTLGIVLLPQPLQNLLLRSIRQVGRGKGRGLLVAGTALALPAVVLLLPNLGVPSALAPTDHSTSRGAMPSIGSRAVIDLLATTSTRLPALSAGGDAGLNRILDSEYATDAQRLRQHEAAMSPSDCLNVDGHGACHSSGGDPTRTSYTIGGSGVGSGLSPIGPVQFWQDDLPPCEDMPRNDVATCEHQYPDWVPPALP